MERERGAKRTGATVMKMYSDSIFNLIVKLCLKKHAHELFRKLTALVSNSGGQSGRHELQTDF